MQPCEQCGAIDDRFATNCHKCGAEFPLPGALETGLALEPAAHSHDVALNAAVLAEPPEPVGQEAVGAATAGSRAQWLLAGIGLSLALFAGVAFVYFDRGHPERLAQKPGRNQWVSAMSDRSRPAETPRTAQTEVVLSAGGSVTKPANGIDASDKAAPASNDSPVAMLPLPANVVDARVRRDSPVSNDCPPAVATLGLCSPDTGPGKGQ